MLAPSCPKGIRMKTSIGSCRRDRGGSVPKQRTYVDDIERLIRSDGSE